MQTPPPSPLSRLSRLSRVAAASVLVLLGAGLAGCGDDDDVSTGSDGAPAGSPASADGGSDAEADEAAQAALADAMGDDRPFGVDDEGMATAMKAATQADRVEVDGSTFRLHFDEGSKDDMRANIHCTAMNAVAGEDDEVVLVYGDGEVRCSDGP